MCGVAIPKKRYSRLVTTKGSQAVRSMARMLSKMLVWVSSATSRALVDTGEHRSPKNTPESTAPPISTRGTPMAVPSVAQMTPMVAAAPKAVPVRTETKQLSKKVIKRNTEGWIKGVV